MEFDGVERLSSTVDETSDIILDCLRNVLCFLSLADPFNTCLGLFEVEALFK